MTKKTTTVPSDGLRKRVVDEISEGYMRLFKKPLPPILTTNELILLNIRPKPALDRDSIIGAGGLQPLPNTSKGKPRKYLLGAAIDFLVERNLHE